MKIPQRLSRETGRDYALRTIKDNIVSLELYPGMQISENELSTEMGLSRTPVREALLELSKVGIIEVYPQKKSVVALIDYDLVEESRFMRNLFECAMVELVCEMATPADIDQLQSNVRLQNFYLESLSPGNLWELDYQFHGMLFSIAKKPHLFELMQNISIHFDRVRKMSLSSVKDLKIVQDHENITIAITRRDAETARALMEKHLSRYKIDAVMIQQQYPQYFKSDAAAQDVQRSYSYT